MLCFSAFSGQQLLLRLGEEMAQEGRQEQEELDEELDAIDLILRGHSISDDDDDSRSPQFQRSIEDILRDVEEGFYGSGLGGGKEVVEKAEICAGEEKGVGDICLDGAQGMRVEGVEGKRRIEEGSSDGGRDGGKDDVLDETTPDSCQELGEGLSPGCSNEAGDRNLERCDDNNVWQQPKGASVVMPKHDRLLPEQSSVVSETTGMKKPKVWNHSLTKDRLPLAPSSYSHAFSSVTGSNKSTTVRPGDAVAAAVAASRRAMVVAGGGLNSGRVLDSPIRSESIQGDAASFEESPVAKSYGIIIHDLEKPTAELEDRTNTCQQGAASIDLRQLEVNSLKQDSEEELPCQEVDKRHLKIVNERQLFRTISEDFPDGLSSTSEISMEQPEIPFKKRKDTSEDVQYQSATIPSLDAVRESSESERFNEAENSVSPASVHEQFLQLVDEVDHTLHDDFLHVSDQLYDVQEDVLEDSSCSDFHQGESMAPSSVLKIKAEDSVLDNNLVASKSQPLCDREMLLHEETEDVQKSKMVKNEGMQRSSNISQSRALEIAEEMEKRAASSGLHLEEGAAAQPMRLEGIQRGPPAIGLLHVDCSGSISQAIGSSSTKRDHGSPQALALHANYIAIGMSKGTIMMAPGKYSGTSMMDSTDTKVFFLGVAEKSYAPVTSVNFNQQGDLLLVGHANGSLVLWDVPRATTVKVISGEHTAAIVHTLFLGQDAQLSKHPKAVTADCKGLVLLHTFTVVPLLRRFSVTSQCLLDGQRTGMVLSISPLLVDETIDSFGGSNVTQSAATAVVSTGLSSMVGGMVGGVVAGVGGDVGRKFLYDGASSDEVGGVVVFVTQQTTLVVRLAPVLEVFAKLSRRDGIRDGSIPYTAWRRLQTQSGISIHGTGQANQGSKEARDRPTCESDLFKNNDAERDTDNLPVLALAWDRKVFILQLLNGELNAQVAWDLDSVACGIAWLEWQMVVVLTSNNQLCLFTKEGVEVERVTINSEEIESNGATIYHTYFMNSFGNPEKAYHNAMAVRGATLFLLGPSHVWRACLLPWQDRIKALQNAGDWMGAFHIAMEVYDGRACGVTGLPKSLDVVQEAVVPALLELLFAYIDEAFAYLLLAFGSPPSVIAEANAGADVLGSNITKELKEQYARVGGVAIEFCVHVRRTDVLFDVVFNKFSKVGQRGTFLELLEPYILKDMLGGLAPEVMQSLVEHYSQKGWLQRVEQCVLHMDIASLDFNQVVRLCRENGLYSALIYLFNKGLDDYVTPLEELITVEQNAAKPDRKSCGYKVLVYLKYCFSGLAFPPGQGSLPLARLQSLRAQLLQSLLEDRSSAITSSVCSAGPTGDNHWRLCYLLSLDLQATLKVLHCAFPEDGPLGICKEGLVQSPSSLQIEASEERGCALEDRHQLVQAVVNALIKVFETSLHGVDIVEDMPAVQEDSRQLKLSNGQIGCILEFISHYVASGYAIVSRSILSKIIEHLTFSKFSDGKANDKDLRRKENLLVRLLRGVPDSEWDSSYVLELSSKSFFWQVTAFLFAKNGNNVAALDSFMKDTMYPENTFMFILEVLSSEKVLDPVAIAEFRNAVLTRLPELLQLSSEAALVVILKHFSMESKNVLSKLSPYPNMLFNYLKAIMGARSQNINKSSDIQGCDPKILRSTATNDDQAAGSEDSCSRLQRLSKFLEKHGSLAVLLQDSGIEFTDEMAELYVELLCKFEPKAVLKFLESYENYRLEHCLKLCQDYGITDAAAFLLERVGDIRSALLLVLAKIDFHFHEMDRAVARLFGRSKHLVDFHVKGIEAVLKVPEVGATYQIMQDAIKLCQRNTFRLDFIESEDLWFWLLDRFVEPLRILCNESRSFTNKKQQGVKIGSGSKQNRVKWHTHTHYSWKVMEISNLATELLRGVLVHFLNQIVNGMIGYIPLPTIMGKILFEHGSHELGDFKNTIMEMLASYGYEQAILVTAKKLVDYDTFYNTNALKKSSTQAFSPLSSVCCVCNYDLREVGSLGEYNTEHGDKKGNTLSSLHSDSYPAHVQIFFCGHVAHHGCVNQKLGLKINSHGSAGSAGCPVCAPVKQYLRTLPRKEKAESYSMDDSGSSFHQLRNIDLKHHSNVPTPLSKFSQSRFELLNCLGKGQQLHEYGLSPKLMLAPSTASNQNATTHSRSVKAQRPAISMY